MPIAQQPVSAAHSRVIAAIQEGVLVTLHGDPWYDVRPLLDPRERSPEGIDRAQADLDYALTVGLAKRHRHMPHLVRLLA